MAQRAYPEIGRRIKLSQGKRRPDGAAARRLCAVDANEWPQPGDGEGFASTQNP